MKKKIFFILTILWTAFIFFNSLQVGEDSAAISGIFADIAKKMLDAIGFGDADMNKISYFIRKAAHFTEFFIQSMLLSLFITQINSKYKNVIIYVLFIGLLTACCDEFLQLFVDGRGSAVKDVFIDFSGTVCSAAVFALARFFCKKHFTKLI